MLMVAEITLGHRGEEAIACDLVGVAAEVGAGAVTVDGRPWTGTLVRQARDSGLAVIGVPSNVDEVVALADLGCDALKIASGDLTWRTLVAAAARCSQTVVLSTGMADEAEVVEAVQVVEAVAPAAAIVLLHSVSAYPVPSGSENLAAIRTLAGRVGWPVGLADHAEAPWAVPMAVALGAAVYERHLRVPRDPSEVDDLVASDPDEWSDAVTQARRARAALGTGEKRCLDPERMQRHRQRRSLTAARDLEAGVRIRLEDLAVARPATGVSPADVDRIVGQTLTQSRLMGEPIRLRDLEHVDVENRGLHG